MFKNWRWQLFVILLLMFGSVYIIHNSFYGGGQPAKPARGSWSVSPDMLIWDHTDDNNRRYLDLQYHLTLTYKGEGQAKDLLVLIENNLLGRQKMSPGDKEPTGGITFRKGTRYIYSYGRDFAPMTETELRSKAGVRTKAIIEWTEGNERKREEIIIRNNYRENNYGN